MNRNVNCNKCKFDGRKCNSNEKSNNNKCWGECKKYNICEKDYIWTPATCSCKNGKYLANIMDDLVITCDEIIESYDEETKAILANCNKKNATCKTRNAYILLAFLLITIALLIAVSIYYYLIKHKANQKYLLAFYVTNNQLKEVLY